MCSHLDSDDRVPVQLNSELHQAHLELLSAHCATYQLRLHYSVDRSRPFWTPRRPPQIRPGRHRTQRLLRVPREESPASPSGSPAAVASYQ